MKKCVVLLLLIWFSVSAGVSQKSHPYLWEVSGGDLKTSSYLFGSMHLNDSRLFNFSDSMFIALSSSKQFAGEMDFDLVDTLIKDMFEELMQGDEEEKESGVEGDTDLEEEDSAEGPFPENDKEGKATIMDPYLYKIAKQLGLESYGLEDYEDYSELSEFVVLENEDGLTFGSSKYENWISYYLSNDMEKLKTVMTDEDMDVYDMHNRNVIQANSFEKLALNNKTFAVVGLGHLVGEKNVLDLLEKKGYHIRRVQESKYSDKFDKTYESGKEKEMFTLRNEDLGIELLSNINNELIEIPGIGGIHFSMDMEYGLMYMSLIKTATGNSMEELIGEIQEEFFTNSSRLKVVDKKKEDDLEVSTLKLTNDDYPVVVNAGKGENIEVVQLVYGFSNRSLKHPHVKKYLGGLKEVKAKELEMVLQRAEEFNFQYLFPDEVAFLEKNIPHEEYKERGVSRAHYKICERNNGNEYLIQVVGNPPGLLYSEPISMHQNYQNRLIKRFGATVINNRLDTVDQRVIQHAQLQTKEGLNVFTKVIINGSFIYIAIQFTNEQNRNDTFFDSFKVLKPSFDIKEKFEYPDAQFSMTAPSDMYKYTTFEEGDSLINYAVNYPTSGVVLDLEIQKLSMYDEYNLDDSIFTFDNNFLKENVDSLLKFETLKYKDVCPGYIIHHVTDSSFIVSTEMAYYCNEHLITLELNSPLALYNSEYLEKLLASVEFKLNPTSVSFFTDRKAGLIINDLSSRDSSTFYKAKKALEYYDGFNEEDIPSLLALFDKPSLDEKDDYNLKYELVVALHDLQNPEIVDKITKHYPKEKNPNTRSIILESLAERPISTQCTDGLIQSLGTSKMGDLYPEEMYLNFIDSMELFEANYSRLKALAAKGIARDEFLGLFQYYNTSNPSPVFVYNDIAWMEQEVKESVAAFKKDLKTDTTASLPVYVMDYLQNPIDTVYRNDLYDFLEQEKDVWAKYRVQYDKLSNGKKPNLKIVQELLDHSYYGYWILKGYDEFKRDLPNTLRDNEMIAKAIIRNQCYEQYDTDCDTCEIIKELNNGEVKIGNTYYIRCTNDELDGYYFGGVGPFLGEGKYDFENPGSAYFSTASAKSETDKLLKQLIEYINSQEE